jgi:hypothetical protein
VDGRSLFSVTALKNNKFDKKFILDLNFNQLKRFQVETLTKQNSNRACNSSVKVA